LNSKDLFSLQPSAPVAGDAVSVAVKAPPACSPEFGTVHWPSVTLKDTDGTTLPSVGGAVFGATHVYELYTVTFAEAGPPFAAFAVAPPFLRASRVGTAVADIVRSESTIGVQEEKCMLMIVGEANGD
jgi:hypothetical protein